VPALLLCPQSNLVNAPLLRADSSYPLEEEWRPPSTYDEILVMLEELELGELKKRHSPSQLKRINEYLIALAQEGILPEEYDEEMVLGESIYDLVYGEDNPIEFIHSLEGDSKYTIFPTILDNHYTNNIIECGRVKRLWRKTKKFCKKHKKESIIGAAIAGAVSSSAAVESGAAATVWGGGQVPPSLRKKNRNLKRPPLPLQNHPQHKRPLRGSPPLKQPQENRLPPLRNSL